MAAGFRTGNVCYPSSAAAADAYFASAEPFLFESMNVVNFITYEKVNGVWSWGVLNSGTMQKSYNQLQIPTFLPCEYSDGLTDGIAMGWLTATVWIAAACVAYLRKAKV